MSTFLKRVFAIMFGAVGVSAVASYATLRWGLDLVFDPNGVSGMSWLFIGALVGGLAISIFAQYRAFRIKPATGALLLGVYSVLIGFTMAPLIAYAAAINPVSIMQAFFIAAIMFACMALFGYKTIKDLSFLGTFLFIGMIGLLLTGLVSFIWPMGGTASVIWSAVAVLVFALFAAYDMQFLKRVYGQARDGGQEGQLAVLGALHLYISFVVMFENVLSLLNSRR
jgi:FtsH-binding integral membrane protein